MKWLRKFVLVLILVVSSFAQTPINITSSLVLTWQQVFNATSYNVKRGTVHLGPYTTLATGITQTTYTDSTVAPKTTYYYVVSATNGQGTSADSSEGSATSP